MRTQPRLLIACSIVASLIGCKTAPPDPVQPVPTPVLTAKTEPPRAAAQSTVQSKNARAMNAPSMPSPNMQQQGAVAAATSPAMVTLKFNPSSIDAIEAGTKTSTTRKGNRLFLGGHAIASDGERTLNLDLVSVTPKKMSELTEAEAKSDGAESLDQFKTNLTTSYPAITGDDLVTVITFKVAK